MDYLFQHLSQTFRFCCPLLSNSQLLPELLQFLCIRTTTSKAVATCWSYTSIITKYQLETCIKCVKPQLQLLPALTSGMEGNHSCSITLALLSRLRYEALKSIIGCLCAYCNSFAVWICSCASVHCVCS